MKKLVMTVILLTTLVAPTAWAGPFGDALGKCLVDSTTSEEKKVLVRWMFAMMALHPDVQSISAVTPEQRTEFTKQAARLFEKLLTETCAPAARQAIRTEGEATIGTSFELLGQVAARELFSDPKVNEGLSEFTKYLDEKKLNNLLEGKEPAPAPPAPSK